ncbi:MAG: protein-glutamate O-methyltransferase CheR [Deltaproteobacteria bacterium]|nr:protein-glutamate O-methyltransferase CheR [Deltaproteobacteria bacterium]
MKDTDCVWLLRWALPQLDMRWPGFRKVRGQTCKRVERRLRELGLAGAGDYRDYLRDNPDEWRVLDDLCRITISRFCRDRGVFELLGREVLPELARRAEERGRPVPRCWCAGCASGEEPYSLALLWRFMDGVPGLECRIIATDSDPAMLARAGRACYPPSSLRELPEPWREAAFTQEADLFCLRPELRAMVEFRCQDIRHSQPDGTFQLILCRNLVFTYYDAVLQRKMLTRLADRLDSGGILVIGIHEHLPEPAADFEALRPHLKIYRKAAHTRTGP